MIWSTWEIVSSVFLLGSDDTHFYHSYTGRKTVVETKASHNMTKFKTSLSLDWTTSFNSGEMTVECLVTVLNKQIKPTLHTFTSVLCWKSGSPSGLK